MIVQKYGGSSLADLSKIKNVASNIKKYKENNHNLIIVVSAMGNYTNELISLSESITSKPNLRELDFLLSTGEMKSASLLALTLSEMGVDAISLNAFQCEIKTENFHLESRILNIDKNRILNELNSGKVVIVCGFQGINSLYDITTLGRGGSDTTAVALAKTFDASMCEIYTDVDGIYDADPRIIENAKLITHATYDDILEFVHLGAKVMHPRSIELAKKYSVPLKIRSSFSYSEGTFVKEMINLETKNVLKYALDDDISFFDISLSNKNSHFSILSKLSFNHIVPDLISFDNKSLSFCIAQNKTDEVKSILNSKNLLYDVTLNLSKVSVIGTSLPSCPEISTPIFECISSFNKFIPSLNLCQSHISFLIASDSSKLIIKSIFDKLNNSKDNLIA